MGSLQKPARMALWAALLLVAAAGVSPAEARILCDGNYQVSSGGPISTPYCEDENLAAVARQYGMRVSGSQIRANEGTKARACRLVGSDNRVSSACASYRNDPGLRRRL